jgi:hypothetical protein
VKNFILLNFPGEDFNEMMRFNIPKTAAPAAGMTKKNLPISKQKNGEEAYSSLISTHLKIHFKLFSTV